jgi:photosystem II stability/assembly factor-like uncharacterized protein
MNNITKIKLATIILALPILGAACTPGTSKTLNDGGAWVTTDKGENWVQNSVVFQDRTGRKGIEHINIKKLVFSPGNTHKLFAITRSNGLWVSWNDAQYWDLILPNSNINDIAINPDNTRIIYTAIGGNIAKSEDEGISWKAVYTSNSTSTDITSLALNPAQNNILYAATNEGDILISENNGTSWRKYSAAPGTLINMQFHPQKPDTIYAAIENVGLIRSLDDLKTWESFEEEFAEYDSSNVYRDFVLIPSGVVYASKHGLLRSLNHGKDWASLPLISGKNDSNIYALAVNPDNPLEIYYGTKSNFYHSIDGGFNWVPRTLPTTRTTSDILINPNNTDTIYMGVSQ